MNHRISLSLLLAFSLSVGSLSAQQASTPEAQRLMESVRVLASPEMTGRAPGTDGNEKAAAWIEQAFRSAGLAPTVANTFRQPFSMTTGVALGTTNNVTFDVIVERPGIPLDKTKPTKISWKLGSDYQPYGFTESRTVSGPVVFAGYGISNKSYDDYAGIDVAGKVVIVLRGTPKWAAKDETFTSQASLRSKVTLARDKGAVAVCFVNVNGDTSDVLSPFGADRLGMNSGMVAVQVRRTPCARIFPPKGTSLFVAEGAIEKTKKPASFALTNVSATIAASVNTIESPTSNVVGLVRGTDASLSNEVIVVGAHYDHLGMGGEHSLHSSKEPQIHPGADDNASGTAGLVELARRIAANPLPRTVLFAAFSGEEHGLVGSKYYVEHPLLPLASTVAMVNMDMIGRLTDNKLSVMGAGTSTAWDALLSSITEGTNLTVSRTADGFGPSDHASFFAKDIPVLFFFTGLHADYHRPTDTWEKLNYDGEAVVVGVVERAIRGIGAAPARPAFTKPAGSGEQQSASRGFKVTFGVIPDYSDDPQGLRITGTKDGSPAAKAGLEGGDIVTKFGATTVKNIYDLTAALGNHAPGDVVSVTVLRNGKPKTFSVTLVGK